MILQLEKEEMILLKNILDKIIDIAYYPTPEEENILNKVKEELKQNEKE